MVRDEVKKELLKAAVPAMVPLARVGINQHYEAKRLKQREEYEVQKARRKAQTIEKAVADDPEQVAEDQPSPFDRPAAESIEEMEASIMDADCDWCKEIAEDLREHPEATRKEGLRELKELQGVMYSDPTREEIDQTMERLDVVPKIAVE